MASIDLREVLKAEGLPPGAVVCPYLSRLGVYQAPLASQPSLESAIVICAGNLCGRFRACQGQGLGASLLLD